MKDKKDFLGFTDLEERHKIDLKILIEKGVRLREIRFKDTPGWQHYFLAEYLGVGIEFNFSDEGERKDKNWLCNNVWKFILKQIEEREV